METPNTTSRNLDHNIIAENVLDDFLIEVDPHYLDDDVPLTQEENDAVDARIAAMDVTSASPSDMRCQSTHEVEQSCSVGVSGLSPDEEAKLLEEVAAELEAISAHHRDEPAKSGLTIQEMSKAFLDKENRHKAARKGKSRRTLKQQGIADYRKGEGRELYNEVQKLRRWLKADEEGRVIKPRRSLKDMSPEEKAAYQAEQVAERQRRFRAKKAGAQSGT